MKRTIAALAIMALGMILAAAPSMKDLTEGYPEDRLPSFLTGEKVEMYSLNGDDVPSIAMPGSIGWEKAVKDNSEDNAFTVALSNFVPYPESWSTMTEEERKLETINRLLKISSIKGITYISYSAGNQPRVLFEDAYALMENRKTKAEDPEFTYAPKNYSYSLNAYLKDSVFGGNTYLIDYEIRDNEVFMTMTNTSDLKLILFKCVSKEELNMCIDVVFSEEGITLFGMATVFGRGEEVKTPVKTVHLPSAFMRRITALRDWFVQELGE